MNLKNLPSVVSRKFALKMIEARPWESKKGWISCGNHSARDLPTGKTIVRTDDGSRDVEVIGNREFWYHHSAIAVVDDYRKVLTVTSAGYGEMSTSAAIRQYAAHFNGLGYKIVVAA